MDCSNNENKEPVEAQDREIPIVSMAERLKGHHERLKKYRGKRHLGLRVKMIKEFNEKMKGLRKLILLAAPPNVGKTALTIQLAQEVLHSESDACMVYVSLEMTAEEIFTRMHLYESKLDYDTFTFGSKLLEDEQEFQMENLFSANEIEKLKLATASFQKIGSRIQIIEPSANYRLCAGTINNFIVRLKQDTGCNRVIVVVDYLQVWPIPEGVRFTSDIEADKWRIGQIKQIRDEINRENQDPVIVISEARKPTSGGEEWGGNLSDVMGSARGTYTPDAVFLLSVLPEEKLRELWEKKRMPALALKKGSQRNNDSEDASDFIGFFAEHGISICSLKMPKGRDGMQKFQVLLAFHFQKNKFEPIDWTYVEKIATEHGKKS